MLMETIDYVYNDNEDKRRISIPERLFANEIAPKLFCMLTLD
jgi:hypothetical protein